MYSRPCFLLRQSSHSLTFFYVLPHSRPVVTYAQNFQCPFCLDVLNKLNRDLKLSLLPMSCGLSTGVRLLYNSIIPLNIPTSMELQKLSLCCSAFTISLGIIWLADSVCKWRRKTSTCFSGFPGDAPSQNEILIDVNSNASAWSGSQ
jgi:hypothetical protein